MTCLYDVFLHFQFSIDDLDVMKNTYAALRQDYDTMAEDASELREKLEEAESSRLTVKVRNL